MGVKSYERIKNFSTSITVEKIEGKYKCKKCFKSIKIFEFKVGRGLNINICKGCYSSLNKKSSGMRKNYKHSEETKKKQSISKLGARNPNFGKKPWNLGKKWSKEMRKKLSDTHKGRSYISMYGEERAKEIIKKISNANKNQIPWIKGKHHTPNAKIKISERMSGDKSPHWLGGLSYEPYGIEFNKCLREKIRQRDLHRCQQCYKKQSDLRTITNRPYKLMIHHIDYNKKNNYPENLISLCRLCHLKTNCNRKVWKKKFISQVAILNSGLMTKEEIFLPYIYNNRLGKTMFELLENRGFNLMPKESLSDR